MFRELFVIFTLVVVAFGSVVPAFKRDAEWEGRIVGGLEASANQFPHQCSLRILNQHFCGCSIINNRWVLSAAHCTFGLIPLGRSVVVGAHHRSDDGITHNVAQFVNHPDYNALTISNDVSVVQTSTVIAFTPAVQPIPLGQEYIVGNVAATVSGWGLTSYPGALSTNLMFLTIYTLTNTDCIARHSPAIGAFIYPQSLCAGGDPEKGVCMGDSGGPLVTNGTLIGIVSWGIACAQGVPDVYTRVSEYRDWILNNAV